MSLEPAHQPASIEWWRSSWQWCICRHAEPLQQAIRLLLWNLSTGPTATTTYLTISLTSAAMVRASASVAASRRRAKRMSVRIAIVSLLIFGPLPALQFASRILRPPEFWQVQMAQMIRPRVTDSVGFLMGFFPPRGADNLESGFAAEAHDIPPACIDLVLAREDAHFGTWRYVNGVDVVGLLRGAPSGRGASTIPMQISRQLQPQWFRLPGAARKLLEIGAASAIVDAHGADPKRLAKTYLNIAPFAKAYGDVRGITAAADALWGLTTMELAPAHCALLVAMLPSRPNLVVPDQKHFAVRHGLALRLLRSHPEFATPAQVALLESWTEMPRRPKLADMTAAATLNLGARTRALVLPHLGRISADQVAARQSGQHSVVLFASVASQP